MSLGKELKSRREARGFSLEEMASTTKIGTRYLEALENDSLDLLPGAFLTRSIIRAYAKFVGLDENETLQKYLEAGLVVEDEYSAARRQDAKTVIPGRNKFIIGAVIIAGLALITVALMFLWKPRKTQIQLNPKTESPALQIKQIPPLPQEKSEPAPASQPVEEKKNLVMQIAFQEETWTEIYADGVRMIYDLKHAGETVEIQANEEILMNIGNAGGLTFSVNGRPGKPLGRTQQAILDIRITPENLQDFVETPESAER